jgi:para-aminobenzoate synthetase / 4-amino-4-deoxychorismate lyase
MACGPVKTISMISTTTPFVLLDDARANGAGNKAMPARLYTDPIDVLAAENERQVSVLFDELRRYHAQGKHVVGYLEYPHRDQNRDQKNICAAWFGVFGDYQEIASDQVLGILPDTDGAYLSSLRPSISRADYATAFQKVQDYILAGDIYQANLTFRVQAQYAGHPLALYAMLRGQAAAGYGGIVWTGKQWHLSFSPELFFALKSGRVTTKPMKGTAARHANPAMDAKRVRALQSDAKQRAENLMIVDLLRNDISRVCDAGSVAVPQLFHIESYPTVHQMTSTVTGQLTAGHDAISLIQAIFPCGSITGAPKIRAMQIIDEIEVQPRGLYCGSIGRIDPNGDAAFNVAIRTLSLAPVENDLQNGPTLLSLGLGSGVVADSVEADEWAECLAKGEFARMTGYGFDLIETMRFEPEQGILRLELHLERMKASARAFDYEFDRHAARNQLHAMTFHLDAPSKIRLLSSQRGSLSIEIAALPAAPDRPWQIGITPLPVAAEDFRLRHKTTDRAFYDDARRQSGNCDEVLFVDAHGFITEGSFTSLFVKRNNHKDSQWITPPLARGLLPSVLRAEMIANGSAIEGDVTIADLAHEFCVGNSLRGLIHGKVPAKAVA